jgi:hypothetical protein
MQTRDPLSRSRRRAAGARMSKPERLNEALPVSVCVKPAPCCAIRASWPRRCARRLDVGRCPCGDARSFDHLVGELLQSFR